MVRRQTDGLPVAGRDGEVAIGRFEPRDVAGSHGRLRPPKRGPVSPVSRGPTRSTRRSTPASIETTPF